MKRRALKAAFPRTIPIMTGFIFLGMAYGIYMNASGFSFIYPFFMSMLIFGGSLEFVCVEMLLSPFAPVQVLIMAVMIQARHLFYGLSMLDKFKGLGWKKYYLIFGMCDETFSVNYTSEIPEDVDRGWFYWVAKKTPEYVQYLGKFLPSAVFGMLVIYCLKNVEVLHGTHGIPEGISILVTAVLHIWKKNMFLSIAGGTICYMLILYFL